MKNYSNEITELEVQITEIKRQRYLLQESTNQKVKEVLDYYFNFFKEMEIKVSNSSATFHSKDEDGFNKEIFSLYFDERYKEKDELRLSYYSSSTNNDFELDRIIRLGNTARVIKNSSEAILSEIHQFIKSDLQRSNELYSFQLRYESKITEYQKANSEIRKTEIELALKSDGVVFDQNVYIAFKRNYTTKVVQLKMIDMSKSEKTCTVSYITQDGTLAKVQNCNVESVLGQVVYFHKNIVSTLELV